MNPATNVNGQHEMHPDAETLSAFTEQALNSKERGEVLAHLAECGRCRQVVALAREAAGAEVAAGRHEAARPGAWWKSWSLALVPAAALAATALVAFYVHERAMERTSDVAKLEQQQAREKTASPPRALPQPRTDAAQPTSTAPPNAQAKPDAPTKLSKTEQPDGARRKPASLPDETAGAQPAAPPPESLNGPVPERQEYRRPPSAEIHGAMADEHAPTQASADDKTPSEAAMYDEERKKQTEAATEERHLYAAKAATPPSPHDSGIDNAENGGNGSAESSTAPSSEQVEVNAQQLQTQPAPDVSAGSLMRMRPGAFSPALMTRPIHLPSGLPALSIASSDHRVLAIDKKGSLFFSEDSGLTWKRVKRQWTGRAILVSKKNSEHAALPAAAASESPGIAFATDALSHSETVFELVNDKSELWLSADGRIWTEE
jgi:putative zinc finger protein